MNSRLTSVLCAATALLVGGCGNGSTVVASSATGGGAAGHGGSGSAGPAGVTSSTSGAGGSPSATTGAGGGSSTAATGSTSSTAGSGGAGGVAKPVGCVTAVSPGHHVLPCAGGIVYDLEIPIACEAGGCGLIVDMHGYTMNATQEDAGTQMRALGEKHGYVVVQPNAPGAPAGWDQATHVPLVFAFLGDVAKALSTDPKRAHSMGFSQGGGMTWRMVCAHADYFASVAPLSGVEGCEFVAPNVPSRVVPTLQVHGLLDNILNFTTVGLAQRNLALASWADGAGTVFQMDATHQATRYKSPGGVDFEFWQHDYQANAILGGHCFPGGTDVGPGLFQFGCTPPNAFVYGELAMQFFLAHPMM